MRFRDDGPDIPESLITAQMAGDVVFVVGAGVSRQCGLPLFDGLVSQIYDRLGQGHPETHESLADAAETEAWRKREWDRTLGLLERRLVYRNPKRPEVDNPVRAAVSEILKPPEGKYTPHTSILELSRDLHGRPRVVTTNFDTLLERAWKSLHGVSAKSFSGPGFPAIGSPEFHGILHLHGRVADPDLNLESAELVLSSGDFGEAYLRSGWASRFVYDLLRRYTLVFVGYSADDPPMRYMLEATEAGRLRFPDLRHAYAFVEVTDGDIGRARELWRAKGLDPITFNNSDSAFDGLYDTLTSWAECCRNCAEWAEEEIKRLVVRPWSEADEETQTKVQFLTEAMASVAVLSRHAADPDWINCLVKQAADSTLDTRAALTWLENRLANFETARWALKANAIKPKLAEAARWLLFTKEQPSALISRFWRLFVHDQDDRPAVRAGLDWLGIQKAVKTGLSYFAISGITDIVRPRLRLEQPWHLSEPSDAERRKEPELHDLCWVTFRCEEWPAYSEILAAWPAQAEAEYRLIGSLDRALTDACELAREVGLITSDRDGVSRDVRLVHAPSSKSLEPIISDPHFNRSNWKPSHHDDYDHSFVPIVRLLSGLWLRLFGHDKYRANAIAIAWSSREELIFRRLAYWAATVSDDSELALSIGRYLITLTTAEFWTRELTAEAAAFWCTRWNTIQAPTRDAIEGRILEGPDPEWFWISSSPSDKRAAANRRRYQELKRIESAGGALSQRATAVLQEQRDQSEKAPERVGVLEGLYHVSWSGWGGSGEVSLIENIPVEELLQRIEAIEKSDQFNQGSLWENLCRKNPSLAFAALTQEASNHRWPVNRWQSFLSFVVAGNKAEVAKPDPKSVARAVCQLPNDALASLIQTATFWLRSLTSGSIDAELRGVALNIWDRLLAVAPREKAGEKESNLNQSSDLMDVAVNDPVGHLAETLVSLQDNSKSGGAGLSADLQPRFDALLQLPQRQRTLAIAELIRSLAFFHWLAPKWTDEKLLAALDQNDADAVALLEVLVKYGQGPTVPIFNRLKSRISRAIEGAASEDALKGLADYVTWAAIQKIGGNQEIAITELEARQLLTRSSRKALRSVAWSLWRALASKKPEERSDFWERFIKPLLVRVWPNDVTARNERVSEMLVKIPANTEQSFPQAADLVVKLVVPVSEYMVRHAIDIDEKEHLVAHYPRELLEFVSATINVDAQIPYDLKEFLQQLSNVLPSAKDDARYQRLNSALLRA